MNRPCNIIYTYLQESKTFLRESGLEFIHINPYICIMPSALSKST